MILPIQVRGEAELAGVLQCSVPAAEADDHEDVHEEVDHVQVDVEGGEDVLLGTQAILVLPAHHQLSVVNDVEGEDERPGAPEPNHHPLGFGEEHEYDPGDHEDDQEGAESSSAGGEVDLGLESEHGEGEGDPRGDADSYEDGVHVVVGGECAQHHPLAGSEDGEEDEVSWSFPPHTLAAHHGK